MYVAARVRSRSQIPESAYDGESLTKDPRFRTTSEWRDLLLDARTPRFRDLLKLIEQFGYEKLTRRGRTTGSHHNLYHYNSNLFTQAELRMHHRTELEKNGIRLPLADTKINKVDYVRILEIRPVVLSKVQYNFLPPSLTCSELLDALPHPEFILNLQPDSDGRAKIVQLREILGQIEIINRINKIDCNSTLTDPSTNTPAGVPQSALLQPSPKATSDNSLFLQEPKEPVASVNNIISLEESWIYCGIMHNTGIITSEEELANFKAQLKPTLQNNPDGKTLLRTVEYLVAGELIDLVTSEIFHDLVEQLFMLIISPEVKSNPDKMRIVLYSIIDIVMLKCNNATDEKDLAKLNDVLKNLLAQQPQLQNLLEQAADGSELKLFYNYLKHVLYSTTTNFRAPTIETFYIKTYDQQNITVYKPLELAIFASLAIWYKIITKRLLDYDKYEQQKFMANNKRFIDNMKNVFTRMITIMGGYPKVIMESFNNIAISIYYNLAVAYYHLQDDQSITEAIKYFEQSARYGCTKSGDELGNLNLARTFSLKPKGKITQDFIKQKLSMLAKALMWFDQAASLGNTDAARQKQLNIASLLNGSLLPELFPFSPPETLEIQVNRFFKEYFDPDFLKFKTTAEAQLNEFILLAREAGVKFVSTPK